MNLLQPVVPAVATLVGLFAGVYLLEVLGALGRLGFQATGVALMWPALEVRRLMRQSHTPPRQADGFLYQSAPLIALTSVALAALVIPVGPGLIGFDPSVGLFYFIVLLSPFIVALMNAGWSANGKAGVFGTFRAATHLISYEVPLGFAAIGAPMAAASLSIGTIVAAQAHLWFAVWQPLGVVIYLITALVVSFHHPFDSAITGSELEGGVLAAYTGPRLLLLRVALDGMFLVLMGMAVELFFGGWHGPLLPGPLWFALKTYLLAGGVIWLSRYIPQLRHDQLLTFSWKVLVPAVLVNIAVVGVLTLVIYGGGG